MTELFYLQDKRSYVGNDILWWAEKGGYTTDLSKAEIFTKEKALRQHEQRLTDVPWPKDYIDDKTRPAVDMQYVEINEALKGTGIKLRKPERYRKPKYRCYECGSFISEITYYAGYCKRCGCNNAP